VGHFENGQWAFDYSTDWPVLAGGFDSGMVEHVIAVLGQGTWREGCVYAENGVSCGADTFDVAPGGILVKVYLWYGGPAVPCRGDTGGNATLVDQAVRQRADASGSTTTWEIRMPGNEFGQPNNVFVEAHTSNPAELARAEALVSSFRWLSTSGSMQCSPSPVSSMAPSPS
jgi:hypothetical protein